MKKVLMLGVTVLGFVSVQSHANVADNVCKVKGTKIIFDLGSNTPADEGSRSFAGISLSTSGDLSNPDFNIDPASTQYIISYADGVLLDGASYFVLSIRDRSADDGTLYVFSRGASEINKAYSTAYSTLSNLKIAQTSLDCGN